MATSRNGGGVVGDAFLSNVFSSTPRKIAVTQSFLPILLGGAKDLGIVYINIIRGAKEPRNPQNHRGVLNLSPFKGVISQQPGLGFSELQPCAQLPGALQC